MENHNFKIGDIVTVFNRTYEPFSKFYIEVLRIGEKQ
jgi:hypothetical protein